MNIISSLSATLVLFFFCTCLCAQITFEKGYVVTSDNVRTECLIKNKDWRKNPDIIEYKLEKDKKSLFAGLDDLVAFGIDGKAKYVKKQVQIDVSNDAVGHLDRDMRPQFETYTTFLEVIVEGSASLYVFKSGKITRFLFSTSDTPVQQLVYKRYIDHEDMLRNNTAYKKQLYDHVNCDVGRDRIDEVSYDKKSLTRYFEDYYDCIGEEYIIYSENEGDYNLSIKLGVNLNKFDFIRARSIYANADYNWKSSIRIGAELEYVFPFHQNKWSLTLDPNYYSLRIQEDFVGNYWGGELSGKLDYDALELPIGVCHKIFLSARVAMLFKILYTFDLWQNSTYTQENKKEQLGVNFRFNNSHGLAFGLGTKMNRWSLEFRVHPYKDLMRRSSTFTARHRYASLVAGYQLF